MSVYSGFATRAQETDYDNLLFNVISLLSMRIIKFYKAERVQDQGFFKILNSNNRLLKRMQKQKYMQPKYSSIISNLLNKLNNDECISQKSRSSIQFPRIQKTLTVNVQPYNKLFQRQTLSQAVSLQRIIERKIKKKKHKKKIRRDTVSQIQLWNLQPKRVPVIQRFKFPSQNISTQRIPYDWESQMSKNVELLKSGKIDKVQIHEQNIQRITGGLKFRSKMYYK